MALKPKSKADGGSEVTEPDKNSVVNILTSYYSEADLNRKGGMNPRDDKWNENLDLYWGRYDFSDKADWQSKEVMPEVPSFVDRFAASMKEAMVAVPENFYTVIDPTDSEGDFTPKLKDMLDVWLSKCGKSPNGVQLGFPAVFEEQCKLGAIMACCAVVTWAKDVPGGRVDISAQDPRFVWFDHSGRNLYRIRRMEREKHDLREFATARDSDGKPLFSLDELSNLVGHIQEEDQTYRERISGHGQQTTSPRSPITIDEYLATIVGNDGKLVFDGTCYNVVANNRFLIRGPERNPYWHGKDWLVYSPMVPTPLSVYGRAYMEDFASVAKTFNTLTNLILDAVLTSSLKAFVVVPGLLLNPAQVQTGIHANKMFLLDEGATPDQFAQALDLGTLPAEAVQTWQAMKNELREASGMNEIGLGQFAPNSRTSATEVSTTMQSASMLIRSVAQTIESRFLDPLLDLVWKTGLQFMSKDDIALRKAVGGDMFDAIYANRKQLIVPATTFQARGISTMMQKSMKLKSIISIMQVIGSNELLMRAFLEAVDMRRLVALLFDLSDIDLSKLQTSQRDALIRSVVEPLNAAGEGAGPPSAPSPRIAAEAGNVAQLMGVARG